jgi:hypothetical protein
MKHLRSTLRFAELRIARVAAPPSENAPAQIGLVFEPTAVEYLPVFAALLPLAKNPDRPA